MVLSVVGLAALASSLAGGSGQGGGGATGPILIWLAATAGAAVAVLALERRTLGVAVANGVAGGLFFSLGDISTKLVTRGGIRVSFLLTLILGYTLGTALLQVGYQAGGALTVAGIATLLTNALPIVGAVLLAWPQKPLEARAAAAAWATRFGQWWPVKSGHIGTTPPAVSPAWPRCPSRQLSSMVVSSE